MKMEINTFEDIKTAVYGSVGTPRRDKIEKELAEFRHKIQTDDRQGVQDDAQPDVPEIDT